MLSGAETVVGAPLTDQYREVLMMITEPMPPEDYSI